MVSVMRDMRHWRAQNSTVTTEPAAAARRTPPARPLQEKPAAGTGASVQRRPFPWRFYGRGLALGIGLSILAWGSWLGWQTLRNPAFMPIETIHIEGLAPQVPLPEVNGVLRPYLQQGFLWLDPQAVRASLMQLPWVANADVRRVWPDRLDVQLTRYQAAARWLGGSGQLLSNHGEVFTVPDREVPKDLPSLYGPAKSGTALLDALKTFDGILSPLSLRVTALEQVPSGGWRCILSDGVRLVLGAQDPEGTLRRWVAVVPQLQSYLVAGATMDLRYDNGFAVALPGATKSGSAQGDGTSQGEK
ncbi:MAG: cell division protein FtsQ/DivIB [Acidithiobacillus sp.]|uniref:cell division protein FtsQ/DivIB n=1 Tax=Acidithiobacillus sp. TaxID=1872118 RepID=UPI003D00015B